MIKVSSKKFQEALLQKRGFTGYKLIFDGLLTSMVGVFLLWQGAEATRKMLSVFALYLIAFGGYNLVTHYLRRVDNRSASFLESLIRIVMGSILLFVNRRTDITVTVPIILVATYQLLMGLIHAITYYLYRKDGILPRGRYLFDAIVLLLLGLSTLLNLATNLRLEYIIVGIYLLFYGFSSIRDGLFFESDASRTNLKRRGRVSLPIILVALMPRASLEFLNRHLYDLDYEPQEEFIYREIKDDQKQNLEIFVHVAEEGFETMGHVDVCYQDQVIAYGNYDALSERLMGSIGDGVLFKVSRDQYIEFCKAQGKMTIFEYGLCLSPEQSQALEQEIAKLDAQLVPWQPSDQIIGQGDQAQPMYAYRLQAGTDARFYKFKSSKFKTYFVLSTNCVLLADTLIGRAGTDILSPRGIITPGTYQAYLEREYAKPHSLVVSRTIYKEIQKYDDTEQKNQLSP
ncbi:DUF308 domain-containing protein [Abiotrophia sp.]|uniref:DUF308 domain-containing protein n=1 Tax=Abiotrophia sp. TaxID=76631 RepID=UPI001CB32A3B|nr:DUF308 domain-containing protein [Abiotrophia sp.]MBF0942073.1 DUF308 domain-containing protein [Abiotrophia sp.]